MKLFSKEWKRWEKDVVVKARKIYIAHRKEWEKYHFMEWVVINTKTGEYFINKEPLIIYHEALKHFPSECSAKMLIYNVELEPGNMS